MKLCFQEGKKKQNKIVWANPASKKKMLFLTANARQGMMNGFSEVHNVTKNGKKILHIHLFHMRDCDFFNIETTQIKYIMPSPTNEGPWQRSCKKELI